MEESTEGQQDLLISTDKLVEYIRTACVALLGATLSDLDASFGEKYNTIKNIDKQCASFAADSNPLVLFVNKDRVSEETFKYRLETKLTPGDTTTSALAVIKKPTPLTDDDEGELNEQLQSVTLPVGSGTDGNAYEVLHSILHFAIAPYFDTYCKTGKEDEKNSNVPVTRKKIAELEMSFLHLQQNIEIPELTLSVHPEIERALEKSNNQPVVESVPEGLVNDVNFLNQLQSNVNSWIKNIQGITRLDRDPSKGTATQEINFWLSMEVTLKDIENQLASPGVTLTLEVLRHAKRFHATVSFLSDTGIKEASEKVAKYNQIMRDFPLDELNSSTSLDKVQKSLVQIFNHFNRKLRITPYPVWRALALVEAISSDLDATLRSLLSNKRIMHLDFDSLNATFKQTSEIFETWEECFKEFTNIARDVTRKRSEKFIPIRINAKQGKTKERLEYILAFRTRHEELRRTLTKVLGSQLEAKSMPTEFEGINPIKEVAEAYDVLKDVDALDTSEEGIASWNAAEKMYNDRTARVEQAIIAMLRDRLATAKNSNEMFRVFSKFNALFIRPSIRGAIQEYQTRLIDNVKADIATLHDRFRQQYSNSEAHEMFKLRDLPAVSGTIIWIRQIEHQLDMYVQKVEDVLGKGWQMYAEGQKLHAESTAFRKKLNTEVIYEDWLKAVSKKNLSVNGFLFKVTKSRGTTVQYDLHVNFNPAVILLFKEVRNLNWLNYQVPHSITSVAKDAKRVYPFAVSLIDMIQSHAQVMKTIDENPQIALLLHGYENEVYSLISKGMGLKWESFVHAYDLKAMALDRKVAAESRHVKFVHGLDDAVNALKTKATYLVELYGHIRKSLEYLGTCNFSQDEFSPILETIQENVDKLSLESYSNVPQFVDQLNQQIEQALITRCKSVIGAWMGSFEDRNRSKELAVPLTVTTHELSLKNQIISLSPAVEVTRASWLQNFQANIATASNLNKIDASRFNVSLAPQVKRRLQDVSNTQRFSNIPLKLYSNVLRAYETIEHYIDSAQEYLGKWYQFQSLWDLEASRVYDFLGDDMKKWLQILNEIRRERTTFDTTESAKLFGLLRIDFQPVQARINSKYDVWQHDILHKFSERLNARMKEVCSEMETSRRELEKQNLDTSSTEMVVSAVTTVQSCQNNLDRWEQEASLFRSGQSTLARHRFQFPPKWLFIDQIDNEWAALKEILGRKSKIIDDQIDAIRARVQAEMKRFAERVTSLETRWQDEKPVNGAIEPQTAINTLKAFENETQSLQHSGNLLQRAGDALELEFKLGPGLEAIGEEVRDFSSVWGALDSVWRSLSDLRETPWPSVVPRKVRQILDSFVQTTKEMPTRIRQYSAFEHVQNHLKNLLKANTLLSDLKSEAIHERHWTTLFKSLAPNKRVSLQTLTLGDVWDLNLTANQKRVQDVVAVANGELALENFLRQVRETWMGYTLELFNYQNTCRLIKGWDELFQTCSEHLNSLQAMHHSPYFKVFEEEARQWEEKLNRVHVLFDVWIEVQRQWVYLEGVFSNNAEIKHILPVESSRFQNINSELFVILRKVYKSPLVLDVLNIPSIQTSIERLADLLGKVQKALGEYFEKERQRFARFYFIGDEDLLEIIGNSQDITRTEKHLGKMFAGISSLVYDSESSIVTGVLALEGEVVTLDNPISIIKLPKVVDWLLALEDEIKLTLSNSLNDAITKFSADFGKDEFTQWVREFPCQVGILATQVYWSAAADAALEQAGLQAVKDRHVALLGHLADTVLEDLTPLDRKKCESLITELIHQRDVLSMLIKEKVTGRNDFKWLSQMTFVYDPEVSDPRQRLTVRQANAVFTYGFEYLGLPDRLVATPLIDKCFLTMTQALDQRLGGSPFGPAGTGKTEAVKALGNALGKFVLVFCCDENFDFQAIGRILLGICQVGAWGCFDEFNRLNEHILSAVSSQIESIELGLKAFKDQPTSEVELIGRNFELNEGAGVFITMNPGYAGRNSLPENLKKLFKSFSMAKPDKEIIADVVLNSQGFVHASQLANKIVPVFTDLSNQLSSQVHYDFGLRALKNVLATCGGLKRSRLNHGEVQGGADWESGVLLQSLRETVAPKLVKHDVELMKEIESNYFKGIEYQDLDVQELKATLSELASDRGLVCSQEWLQKALELYRFQQIHHGIMLVGDSGTGKTTVYRTLLEALQRLEKIDSQYHLIDAKVMSKDSLYGTLDTTTREWTDGLFTSTLRRVVDNLRGEANKRHWIVFDGDVDPEWVENLNSVLDDNKLLTLPNGERIALPENVRLLFEVENLQYATPATVSRCGMIWFGDSAVTPEMQLQAELYDLRNTKFEDLDEVNINVTLEACDIINDIFETANTSLRDIIAKAQEFGHVMEFGAGRFLSSFFSLVKSACLELLSHVNQSPDFPPGATQRANYLTKRVLLALLWSLAGDCSLTDRTAFGEYLLLLPCFVSFAPPKTHPLVDYEVSLPDGDWTLWLEHVPKVDLDTHAIIQTDVVVPTVDTCRHESLIYSLLNDHKPLILCGPPGSGKTMTLFAALRKSPNLDVVGLNFSKATTPELLIKSIEQYCEYKKTMNGIILSPTQIGRWLVVFCDEINLPATDAYGTQHVISLLRQMVQENGFWNRDRQWVSLQNIQFVGACNPPADVGRNALSLRFLRHTAVVFVDYPGEVSLRQIYGAFNTAILKCVPSLRGYSNELTSAMIEFYLRSQQRFTPEVQSHYIYSPRELTRWCRGIYDAIMPLEHLSAEGLIRIWAHEALRLFHDRLVEDFEKQWTYDLVQEVASKYFLNTDLQSALEAPILYSNWLSKNYVPVDRLELQNFVKARVKTFCEEELDTPLILYDDLLDHVLRIDRVLRQHQGHLILIGVSGSGKTTLSRFVAWMNGLKTFQLKTTRKYSQEDFDADLRGVLRRTGCQGEKMCFILDESNILESSFLERMNTLLANGEVPGLFEGDDYTTLMTACKEGAMRQGLNLDSEDELYKWFTSEIVKNLHVIFTMNPPDSDLSSQAAASPALFNRCVLNWMGDWSDRTLYQVGAALSDRLDLDKSSFSVPDTVKTVSDQLSLPSSFREAIYSAMVFAHKTVRELEGIKTTPGDFLDFVQQFSKIYLKKGEELEDQQRHFNVGLDKLKETVIKVKEMRTSLAEKKAQLEAKDNEAKEMLRQMVSDQNEAERKREASIEIQHALKDQDEEIKKRTEVVHRDLERAEPAVREAQNSVNNIKKQQLTELRAMMNPPAGVKMTLESVCTLLGHHGSTWREISSFVRRDDFISSIVNFDNETMMTPQLRAKMEQEYLARPEYNYETVNRASRACGPLLQWVIAQVDYSSILERVGPLRNEVYELEAKADETKAQAQAIGDMINELEKSIEKYKDDYAQLITETQSIKAEMLQVQNKVDRSVKLLDSLSSEKTRWQTSIKEFQTKRDCLAGNCFLSSAFIAYSGFFDQQTRKYLRDSWAVHLDECGVQFEQYNKVADYLATGKQKLQWHDNSLPSDDLCVENAIMTERYIRYPFIIDPTARVTDFLVKEHESTRKLTITSFLDDAFVKHLESALRFGNPILIQDAEHLDPVINQVLNKEFKKTGGRTLITLGRQDIDYSNDFKMYLLTRDPSVKIAPHISSRTTVVNFTITRSSLESQALNQVLQVERPDVETKRKELIKLQSEYRVALRQLEENLLQALSESEGSILENDQIIDTLERLKVEAQQVEAKVEETDKVMETIEQVMTVYEPLAKHCGSVFSVLEKLALLNSYYQFSLEYFLQIFGAILSTKNTSDSVEKRVEVLVKQLYLEGYQRTSSAILSCDHGVFALLLVSLFMNVDTERFSTLLAKNVDGNTDLFEKLATTKSKRPQEFLNDIDKTCVAEFGQSLIYSNDNLHEVVVHQVDANTPVAMCVAPGSDPSFKISLLLDKTGVKCETVAMGSMEGEKSAERAIQQATQQGSWVVLQNVHLSPAWLENFSKQFKTVRAHPDFRFIITMQLGSRAVPTTLLRMSRLIMVESAPGIKASMQSTFNGYPPQRIANPPTERARLYFMLSWVHGVVQERLRFVPLGWMQRYDFNDSDFESGAHVVDTWVDKVAATRSNVSPEALPWDALNVLISDTIYGGKVDNDDDATKLRQLVAQVFNVGAYNLGFELAPGLKSPESGSYNDLQTWVAQLPDHEPPTWLGLKPDADDAMLAIQGKRIADETAKILIKL